MIIILETFGGGFPCAAIGPFPSPKEARDWLNKKGYERIEPGSFRSEERDPHEGTLMYQRRDKPRAWLYIRELRDPGPA